jgi:hypothetical protein
VHRFQLKLEENEKKSFVLIVTLGYVSRMEVPELFIEF